MNYLASILCLIGPLSLGALVSFLAILGKRLGHALELRKYYKLYYVSVFFFVIPIPVGFILLLTGAWGLPEPAPTTGLIIRLAIVSVPMSIAITFAVFATAKYWGWIWRELGRGHREDGKQDGPF
jgi:hypothetical protein